MRAAEQTSFPAESVPVVDRAYFDYQWLADLDISRVIFVTRLKSNADFAVIGKFLTGEKHEHILSDEEINLTGFYTSKKYPGRLRAVRVYDAVNHQTLTLLTNRLSRTADTISQLCKARRDVDCVF